MKKNYYWIVGITIVLIGALFILFLYEQSKSICFGCNHPNSNVPTTATEMKVESIFYPDIFKGISLEINIANNKFTLLDSRIAKNGYPNYLPGSYPFVARIFSSDEKLLGEYGFGDPRIILAEQGYTGPTWIDNVNFTLTLPYFNNSKSVNIYSSTQMLLSVDVSGVE